MNKVIAGHTVPPNEQKSEGSQTEEWNKQPFFFSLDLDSNYYVYILMSYHFIQQYICCFGSAFGLNQRRRKKKSSEGKQNKNPWSLQREPGSSTSGFSFEPINNIRWSLICNHSGLQAAQQFQTAGGSVYRIEVLTRFWASVQAGPLLHFVGSVRFILPYDGQGVSLGIEDPVFEW